MRWNDMKTIVDDNGRCLNKFAMNESAGIEVEDDFMGDVGGKYDIVMMLGDGTVYGMVGEAIHWMPIGDMGKPSGFYWKRAKGVDCGLRLKQFHDCDERREER